MKWGKWVVRLVLQFAAVAAVSFLGSQAAAATQDGPALMLVVGLLTATLAIFVHRLVAARMERRPVDELSGRGAAPGLAWGTLGGLAIFGLVILTIAVFGGYQVHGFGTIPSAVGLLGVMAAAAATEELMFRGVLFRIVEERAGTWFALVATGLLFGMAHLFNPDASLWGAIAIAIEAGGMLTAAYVATRTLWVPIGLHFGWNFAAGGIFGTAVSGNGTSQGLLSATMSGPDVLTGGAFGPEGSVYSVVFCVLATIAFLRMAHRRGNLKPFPRRGPAVPDQRGADETAALTRLSR
ncbi:CPBP family intramembrane glutamic endopeptidase [Amycolatopsis jiangsuensis]|uniref:Membrane protease YdiL (CAAX protease family) n=1 Tax=Amycolatopsis jiangsuensis TaxID=1181879 RepID=A0A840IZV9_9PSEU|nr:type II CAAX endopeptidase family protein [Amycolatopsis jiangsuensis]MBB4686698.1 membrane protease YdiL (CAAX protease family) [Amycolatopsis jiangsuensis]